VRFKSVTRSYVWLVGLLLHSSLSHSSHIAFGTPKQTWDSTVTSKSMQKMEQSGRVGSRVPSVEEYNSRILRNEMFSSLVKFI
jgi:hypothetical protein